MKNMLATDTTKDNEFNNFIQKLTQKSANNINPYRTLVWPDRLPEDIYWMSPDLLSVYNTPMFKELDDEVIKKLSKWESINFYSLNVHGIKELLTEVINRIHTPGFESSSSFFHHFIEEENQHMWFFSEFCRRYGGKIYPFLSLNVLKTEKDIDIESKHSV